MNSKIKSIVYLFVFILTPFFAFAQGKSLKKDTNSYAWVLAADLTYHQPVIRSEEGMPVGNGRMGSLVWTSPSALKFQINRVDIFGNNTASNNFYERNTDYCGGAGFVDVNFVDYGDDVFKKANFSQHLSCLDGLITTEGKEIKTRTLAWNEQDVMAIEVDDLRKMPSTISVNLRMLRQPVVKTGNHTATSKISIVGNAIVLSQVFEEDGYYCSSAVVIGISGRDVKPVLDNETKVKLVAKPGNELFTIYISSAATFDHGVDVTAVGLSQLNAAMTRGFEEIYQSNLSWWKNFWDKGYVHLHSADGEADFIEQNYAYFLYVMASSSRGVLPPKFNGMLWTTGGDARKWGNLYWGANQSCLYNGLFPANRMELIEPMFNLYNGMKSSLELAAQEQWGSKGIYIPEVVGIGGLPKLPQNMVKEVQELYLNKKPWSMRSDSFYRYASTQMSYLSRWNWKKDEGWKDGVWHFSDKGAGPFGHVTHIFSRGAKIAYQYWQRYEYTRDTVWLRNYAYPMLRGVAEFYRNFPNVKKESDGKYHIYDVNDNESIWGGHNTVEEISSMMGIFPAAIRASEILHDDKEMRPVWKEFLDNLSPLPLSNEYSKLTKAGAAVTWVRALPPIIQGEGWRRPDSNTMPVWFFDLCNQGSENTEMQKIANATYDSYFPEGINQNTPVYVLSKLPVAGTILGRKEATRYLIPNQIRTAEIAVMANRMTLREGYQTTGIQRLGRVADALHNALCQSAPNGPGKDPVIRVFPAWPDDWDAEFKLLCRGNFLVTSSFKNGEPLFVEILSQSGADCQVWNPWPGKTVAFYRDGEKAGKLKGSLLKFKTQKGENIRLLRDNKY